MKDYQVCLRTVHFFNYPHSRLFYSVERNFFLRLKALCLRQEIARVSTNAAEIVDFRTVLDLKL